MTFMVHWMTCTIYNYWHKNTYLKLSNFDPQNTMFCIFLFALMSGIVWKSLFPVAACIGQSSSPSRWCSLSSRWPAPSTSSVPQTFLMMITCHPHLHHHHQHQYWRITQSAATRVCLLFMTSVQFSTAWVRWAMWRTSENVENVSSSGHQG